jgi:hypothetical protein
LKEPVTQHGDRVISRGDDTLVEQDVADRPTGGDDPGDEAQTLAPPRFRVSPGPRWALLRYDNGRWLAVNWLNALPSLPKPNGSMGVDIAVANETVWIATTAGVFCVGGDDFARVLAHDLLS